MILNEFVVSDLLLPLLSQYRADKASLSAAVSAGDHAAIVEATSRFEACALLVASSVFASAQNNGLLGESEC